VKALQPTQALRGANAPAAIDVQSSVPPDSITVTTKEDFDRLPSGAVYTGKDGRKYRKP
jgi:hypothetical protein